MKAAVLVETGKPLALLDGIELPQLKPGQVRVRLIYSAVCNSQLMEVRGGRGEDKYLPHLLGHEGVGIVEEIGEGVDKVSVGQKVILGWIKGQGAEVGGTLYESPIGTLNSGAVTTFSEQTVVSENRVVPLPKGLPSKVSVLFGCALPTGAGIVLNQAQPEKGSTIVVFGLGGIGLSCLLAASLSKPTLLVAVDPSSEKRILAEELGATHTLDSNLENLEQALAELTGGKGFDYAFEASGSTHVIELAFSQVRDQGGRCIFASHPSEEYKISLRPHDFHRGKRIEGSWGGASYPDRDVPLLAKLYTEQKVPLEKLLSHEYPLDDINDALDDLEAGKVVRALISINPELDK